MAVHKLPCTEETNPIQLFQIYRRKKSHSNISFCTVWYDVWATVDDLRHHFWYFEGFPSICGEYLLSNWMTIKYVWPNVMFFFCTNAIGGMGFFLHASIASHVTWIFFDLCTPPVCHAHTFIENTFSPHMMKFCHASPKLSRNALQFRPYATSVDYNAWCVRHDEGA